MHECIKYLRVNRIGVLDFIPLDKVRLKPVEEKLRTLGPQYRLAEHILKFDPAVERAVRYACGSAIIADSRADARALRFGGRSEEVKVVSADDGTLFAKNATMTGGLSGEEAGRSARWDAAALEDLKRQVRSAAARPPARRACTCCAHAHTHTLTHTPGLAARGAEGARDGAAAGREGPRRRHGGADAGAAGEGDRGGTAAGRFAPERARRGYQEARG